MRLARHWLTAVVVSLALFTPWLWVILTHRDRIASFTGWMYQPVGHWDTLTAWAHHLVQTFVALTPYPAMQWNLILLPIGVMLWVFMRHAPRLAVSLLLLTAAGFGAIVLGPDLLGGGSRSLQARYVLPVLLVVELAVAWTLGAMLTSGRSLWIRRLGLASLAALILMGGASQIAIQRANTWSTKNFSAQNAEVARLAGASSGQLILASDPVGVGIGELISLAYHLPPNIRIWGEPAQQTGTPPSVGCQAILLTPSPPLLARFTPACSTSAIAGTWQWLSVSAAVNAKNQVLSPPSP